MRAVYHAAVDLNGPCPVGGFGESGDDGAGIRDLEFGWQIGGVDDLDQFDRFLVSLWDRNFTVSRERCFVPCFFQENQGCGTRAFMLHCASF